MDIHEITNNTFIKVGLQYNNVKAVNYRDGLRPQCENPKFVSVRWGLVRRHIHKSVSDHRSLNRWLVCPSPFKGW